MKQQLRRTSEMKNINGAFKNPSLRGTKQSSLDRLCEVRSNLLVTSLRGTKQSFFVTSLRGTKQSNLSLTNPFRLLHSAKADVRKDGN